MENTNTIGKDYSTRELVKFVFPPVLAQFSMSLLSTLDDGLFLSRFVGPFALAAFSIAMPVFMLFMALSELFNGASVICSTKMGEGKGEEAKRIFTSIVIMAAIIGMIFSLISRIFLDPVIRFMGGTEILFPYVKAFLSVGVWYIPLILVNHIFSRFYVPSGNSKMSLYTTLINAFCNFFFDWVFIVKMRLGMVGSAYANLIANCVLFLIGVFYYSRKTSEICFARPDKKMISTLVQSAKFGFPPFLTHMALSVNSFIANQVLLHVGGEESISAYTIINNIQFMFMSGLWGLSSAVSPLVSYAFGEQNKPKIRKIIKQIIQLGTGLVLIIILIYFLGKNLLLSLYLKSDAGENIHSMAEYGLTVAPLAFLFFAYNVLAIDISLALNDKKTSTILTVFENLIFANLSMLLLPNLFGVSGVWFAFAAGEILTFAVTLFFFMRKKADYADCG